MPSVDSMACKKNLVVLEDYCDGRSGSKSFRQPRHNRIQRVGDDLNVTYANQPVRSPFSINLTALSTSIPELVG